MRKAAHPIFMHTLNPVFSENLLKPREPINHHNRSAQNQFSTCGALFFASDVVASMLSCSNNGTARAPLMDWSYVVAVVFSHANLSIQSFKSNCTHAGLDTGCRSYPISSLDALNRLALGVRNLFPEFGPPYFERYRRTVRVLPRRWVQIGSCWQESNLQGLIHYVSRHNK